MWINWRKKGVVPASKCTLAANFFLRDKSLQNTNSSAWKYDANLLTFCELSSKLNWRLLHVYECLIQSDCTATRATSMFAATKTAECGCWTVSIALQPPFCKPFRYNFRGMKSIAMSLEHFNLTTTIVEAVAALSLRPMHWPAATARRCVALEAFVATVLFLRVRLVPYVERPIGGDSGGLCCSEKERKKK